ncbi:MAG: D-glycerate dehydrogenase [Patescibacteria group bacterium]
MSNVLIGFNPTGYADQAVAILKKAGHKVTTLKKTHNIPQAELLKAAKGRDAVLPLLSNRIDEAFFLAAGPRLKIVANYAVGFDNVDLVAAKKHHVVITNTPCEEVNESVAEHTFALMIALAHRVAEAHIFTTHEKYRGWMPDLLLGMNLKGRTLGLIGAGRIGAAVAERAVKGFGMKVMYSDMNKNEFIEKQYGAKKTTMENLLKHADFVSLHVPLLPSTRHLISTKQIAMMKKTAYLINTARGPVVDEHALAKALKAKRIAGAGIDVFECEPSIACNVTDNKILRSLPNAVLTPHIASATFEAREAMARVAAQNIVAVLAGKKPLTPAR